MITTADLVGGLARWLDDEGLADYKTDEPYLKSDRAVTVKRFPASPDIAVAIYPYGTGDATLVPGSTFDVQLRFRGPAGDRLFADRWADEVAAKLHWKHQFLLGDVHVQRSQRVLAVPLGADDNGREERADSYELILLNR